MDIEKNILYFKKRFSGQDPYRLLLEMGKGLPRMSKELFVDENKVEGCQSIVYIQARIEKNKVNFQASSDALISAGLAALLINIYKGFSPEQIIQSPPDFIKELNIETTLSPSRSNGFYQMYLHMKKKALQLLHTSV